MAETVVVIPDRAKRFPPLKADRVKRFPPLKADRVKTVKRRK